VGGGQHRREAGDETELKALPFNLFFLQFLFKYKF
jgi:hypothetical protein